MTPVDVGAWAPDPVTFPIAVVGDRLVDNAGDTLIVNGDTPWSLVVQLDSSEVLDYLDTRSRQGVNAILLNLIEHRYADNAPANAYGLLPFIDTLAGGEEDLRSLNDPYWDFVEWVVAQARERGIVCFVVPAYVGYEFNSSGWSRELAANGVERLSAYGDSLARRLGPHENVIWVLGGDWGPAWEGRDLRAEMDAISASIERSLPEAVMTAHTRRNLSALDSYAGPWLDINTTYSEVTHGPVRLELDRIRTGGVAGPLMPSLWIEGFYENEHDMSGEMVRAQIYWSLLSATSGHFYGAHPVWSFGAGPAEGFGDSDSAPYHSWRSAMVSEVAEDLIHARRLIDELPLARFRPDFGGALVTSPRGEEDDWVAVARTPDDSRAVIYTPRPKGLTIDLSALRGDSVQARWIDPREGTRWDGGTYPSVGGVPFRPPAGGDWLLLLEGRDD
jgi:hypothetical protein